MVTGFEDFFAARSLAPPRPPGEAPAIVFADLAGYTRLMEGRGDEAAVRLAAALQREAEVAAPDHDGQLVKLLSDGRCCGSRNPDRRVLASLSLV
jgi:class 3 adenylate cyclase